MLKIEHLYKSFPKFQLSDVSLHIEKGTVMGLIGENGAGKSTLIGCISNYILSDSGEIKIFGQNQRELTCEQKEKIGVIFDELCIPDVLYIRDVEKIMIKTFKSFDIRKYHDYLDFFKLDEGLKIKELSKGMKMKLQFAYTLAHNPKLLVLDEATAGLDPIVRDEILDILFNFVKNGETSILISSHILSDIEKIADYVTFIHEGKILLSDTKDNLLNKYVICRGNDALLKSFKSDDILGVRKGTYSIEICVLKEAVNTEDFDQCNLEDIMLFAIRGEK